MREQKLPRLWWGVSKSIAHETHIITGTPFSGWNSLFPFMSRAAKKRYTCTFEELVTLMTSHDPNSEPNAEPKTSSRHKHSLLTTTIPLTKVCSLREDMVANQRAKSFPVKRMPTRARAFVDGVLVNEMRGRTDWLTA